MFTRTLKMRVIAVAFATTALFIGIATMRRGTMEKWQELYNDRIRMTEEEALSPMSRSFIGSTTTDEHQQQQLKNGRRELRRKNNKKLNDFTVSHLQREEDNLKIIPSVDQGERAGSQLGILSAQDQINKFGSQLELAREEQKDANTIILENMAFSRTAHQSCDYDDEHGAHRAVDGKVNGGHRGDTTTIAQTCGWTRGGDWWMVDLGSDREIQTVKVWEMERSAFVLDVMLDTSRTREISATYHVSGQDTDENEIDFDGGKIFGRYVRIRREGGGQGSLTLAEVQVFGPRASLSPPVGGTESTLELRRDWTTFDLSRLSRTATGMYNSQSNCNRPLMKFMHRGVLSGLGADFSWYAKALCYVRNNGGRMLTVNPWIYRDEGVCNSEDTSAMSCYFPHAEDQCGPEPVPTKFITRGFKCRGDRGQPFADTRRSTIEFLFSKLSPLVVEEAKRQLSIVFPNGVPSNLITVHVRWGDKKFESELTSIEKYIGAARTLAEKRGVDEVNIFLSTYDAEAVRQFKEKAPKDWNVYLDAFYAEANVGDHEDREWSFSEHGFLAESTKGRLGLVSLGSLLVAMEANDYVLTMSSNWSFLMDALRERILDKECQGCTRKIGPNE